MQFVTFMPIFFTIIGVIFTVNLIWQILVTCSVIIQKCFVCAFMCYLEPADHSSPTLISVYVMSEHVKACVYSKPWNHDCTFVKAEPHSSGFGEFGCQSIKLFYSAPKSWPEQWQIQKFWKRGAEEFIVSFIANAHNGVYAFNTEKGGFKKNWANRGRPPQPPPPLNPLLDQRAGQLSLPFLGITKTEKNRTES